MGTSAQCSAQAARWPVIGWNYCGLKLGEPLQIELHSLAAVLVSVYEVLFFSLDRR